MAFKSATGGHIVLPNTPSNIVIPNGKWVGTWTTAGPNVTQSDCGGAEVSFGTNQTNRWSAELVRDDTSFPEAIGLEDGTTVPVMYFKIGAGDTYYKLQNTFVETVEVICDTASHEPVRCTLSGKSGLKTIVNSIS
jgi:hypothetical protein